MLYEEDLDVSAQVASKVLQRAEVARMARLLHDRLAFASYKAQHGQENLSLRDVEARLNVSRERRRADSSYNISTPSSSASSSDPFAHRDIASSPIRPSYLRKHHPNSIERSSLDLYPAIKRAKITGPRDKKPKTSWKVYHNLAQSSPMHAKPTLGPSYQASQARDVRPDRGPDPKSSPSRSVSENRIEGDRMSLDGDQEAVSSPVMPSSPPQTPPPSSRKIQASERHHSDPNNRNSLNNGQEGADLLLYLATSPSPRRTWHDRIPLLAPSTPPPKTKDDPSKLAQTPSSGLNGLLDTPSQQFNFADFVNVTPSPARGILTRNKPGLSKTPYAAREAHRKLNLDAVLDSVTKSTSTATLGSTRRASRHGPDGLGGAFMLSGS